MLSHGDELARTQRGNNNAYCQDNEISWVDWNLDRRRRDLLEFTRHLMALRKEHPAFRRRQFFYGRRIRGSEVKDLSWFRPDGKEMTEDDWNNPHTRCFGLRIAGDAITEVDARGDQIVDDTFLILLNAYHEPLNFVLPAPPSGGQWEALVDTSGPDVPPSRAPLTPEQGYELGGRCLVVLRLRR
jgi:isoamylase